MIRFQLTPRPGSLHCSNTTAHNRHSLHKVKCAPPVVRLYTPRLFTGLDSDLERLWRPQPTTHTTNIMLGYKDIRTTLGAQSTIILRFALVSFLYFITILNFLGRLE